jgi:hypothetical protein
MLAEEGQPDAAEAERAVGHHFQRAIRMGLRVESEREIQHMLEEGRHHGETAPMRQAVGMERDEHAGADIEEAETDPEPQWQRDLRPAGLAAGALRARKRIHDMPEQDRLGELPGREAEIDDGEDESKAALGAQQRESARVERDDIHLSERVASGE